MNEIGRALPYIAFWAFLALTFPPMCESAMQNNIRSKELRTELLVMETTLAMSAIDCAEEEKE
jgi:hypothetical protein